MKYFRYVKRKIDEDIVKNIGQIRIEGNRSKPKEKWMKFIKEDIR